MSMPKKAFGVFVILSSCVLMLIILIMLFGSQFGISTIREKETLSMDRLMEYADTKDGVTTIPDLYMLYEVLKEENEIVESTEDIDDFMLKKLKSGDYPKRTVVNPEEDEEVIYDTYREGIKKIIRDASGGASITPVETPWGNIGG